MIRLLIKALMTYKHSPVYCYNEHGVKCKKGIVGAIIAAATITAGAIAASGARSAAETQAQSQREALSAQQRAAQEEAERRGEAVDIQRRAAEGRRAGLAGIKLPTLLETPSGQELKATLQERIAGRGLSQIDVAGGTAAFAGVRRAGVEREKAAVGSAASAAGLGRSILRPRLVGEAVAGGERDIALTTADLQRQNVVLEAQQIVDSLNRFQQLTNQELSSQQKSQLFEAQKVLAEESGQIDIANTIAGNASIERSNQFAISESIAAIGATEAAGQLQQAALIGSGILEAGIGFGQAISRSNEDIISAIQQSEQDRGIGAVVLRGQEPGAVEQRRLNIFD